MSIVTPIFVITVYTHRAHNNGFLPSNPIFKVEHHIQGLFSKIYSSF